MADIGKVKKIYTDDDGNLIVITQCGDNGFYKIVMPYSSINLEYERSAPSLFEGTYLASYETNAKVVINCHNAGGDSFNISIIGSTEDKYAESCEALDNMISGLTVGDVK